MWGEGHTDLLYHTVPYSFILCHTEITDGHAGCYFYVPQKEKKGRKAMRGVIFYVTQKSQKAQKWNDLPIRLCLPIFSCFHQLKSQLFD